MPRVSATLAALTLGACTAASPPPPEHDPYFPATIAMSGDEGWLFVANANSDLSFGSGTVQAWALAAIADLATTWAGGAGTLPEGCTMDGSRPELAHCPSTVAGAPAGYVGPNAVQIGNFVAGLAAQTMDGGRYRLFATVRGDPSITWIDFDPTSGQLACGGSGAFPRCDEAHRLDTMRNDPDLEPLGNEPYGVAVDSAGERVVVTHLSNGNVSLVLAPRDPARLPELVDKLTGIWDQAQSNGLFGAIAVAPRLPGDAQNLFYVTGRFEAKINVVRAVAAPDDDGDPSARLVLATSFMYPAQPQFIGADGQGQSLRFSPDGDRAYLVARQPTGVNVNPILAPTSLVVIDTSLDAQGVPVNVAIGSVELCQQPTSVDIYDAPGDETGVYAYVTCFGVGEVWVVDVEHYRLVDTIVAGRGPSAIVVAPGRQQAYVSNYGEDTVSVIDLDPTSPTYHHAVLELGLPRVTP